jgi:hypothetical protein
LKCNSPKHAVSGKYTCCCSLYNAKTISPLLNLVRRIKA